MKEFIEAVENIENELGGVTVFWWHDMPWYKRIIISYGSMKTKLSKKLHEQDHTFYHRINDTAQAMHENSVEKCKYALVQTFS